MAERDDAEQPGETAKGGGKVKLIIIVLPVVLVIGAAAWFFLLRGDGGEKVKAIPEPTPGPVVTLDPITVNLASGHFLKLGLALQTDASAKEVDGSHALDLAISEFSGETIDELSSAEGRERAKRELLARIKFAYLPESTDAEEAAQDAMRSAVSPKAAKISEKSGGTAKKAASSEKPLEPSALTSQQVITASSELTVLPMVYDLYFTEFVMQ
jgi:flagellar FliL protein